MTHPEMSAPTLALYLRRIRLTRSVSALHALAESLPQLGQAAEKPSVQDSAIEVTFLGTSR